MPDSFVADPPADSFTPEKDSFEPVATVEPVQDTPANLLSPTPGASPVPVELQEKYAAIKLREARRAEEQQHPIREAARALTTSAINLPDVKPLDPKSVFDRSVAAVVNKLKSSVVEPLGSPLGAAAVVGGGAVPLVGKTLAAGFGIHAVVADTPEFIEA